MDLQSTENSFSQNYTPRIEEKINISEIIQSLSDDETSKSARSESFTQHPTFDQSSSYTEKPKSYKTGGFTCCVPQCYNNSKVNKDLSFYVIPKDPELRKKWLHKISRKNFNPTTGHRVCSVHFEGGKKTYTNSVPTIVPKTIKLTTFKERLSQGLKRSLPSPEDKIVKYSLPELTNEEKLKLEVECLKKQIVEMTSESK